MVWEGDGAHGECAAWEAGAAVLGSVGSEFGGAQDHVIRPRAVIEDYAQVSVDSADLLGAAGIGDLCGAQSGGYLKSSVDSAW